MMRAVVFSPLSHGTMRKVSGTGARYMSDSAIRAKPSIDEPSNQVPYSNESASWWTGIVTLFTMPLMSVNCRLTKRTFCSSASRRTSSFVLAVIDCLFSLCMKPLVARIADHGDHWKPAPGNPGLHGMPGCWIYRSGGAGYLCAGRVQDDPDRSGAGAG